MPALPRENNTVTNGNDSKSFDRYNNLQVHVFIPVHIPPFKHVGLQIAEN